MSIPLKIAYIGGGSKMWARIFMNDLALDDAMQGEISLYDIDTEAAKRNQMLGELMNHHPLTQSHWTYTIASTLEECLAKATFVVLSILPGTFEEMKSDVHEPESVGIYQTVGDTVGPGGVIRAMRTVPLYEVFANKIKDNCPNAWVINLTNPMSICVKTLYDVFPQIKAFGCCHEVFQLGLKNRPNRKQIQIDVGGINHFTWITQAHYVDPQGHVLDIFPMIPAFMDLHFEEGIYHGKDKEQFKYDTYAYGNKVKMDLYQRYGVLAAAGDRHLVEFVNNKWYLENLDVMKKWAISITPVHDRIIDMNKKIQKTLNILSGKEPLGLNKSNEEAIDMMRALIGLGDLKTNVNYPNHGQMKDFPHESIVETNCVFSKDRVTPIPSKALGTSVNNLCLRNLLNIEGLYEGIKKRDFHKIFASFINQPLCSSLSPKEGLMLFKRMIINTKKCLEPFYDLKELEQLKP